MSPLRSEGGRDTKTELGALNVGVGGAIGGALASACLDAEGFGLLDPKSLLEDPLLWPPNLPPLLPPPIPLSIACKRLKKAYFLAFYDFDYEINYLRSL